MSIESVARMMQAQNVSPREKLILIGIANHDGDNGAWPAVKTLASYACCSVRTAQRTIKAITTRRLIDVVAKGADTNRMPPECRPNLYILNWDVIEGGGDIAVSPGVVTPDVTRGGDIAVSPHEPSIEPSIEPSEASSQTSPEVRASSAPSCPYEKLVALYRQHFPDQRQPRTDLSDRRKAIIRKGWLHASRRNKSDGSGLLYNGDPTGVTFWDSFMCWIAKHCDFCMQEQTNFDIEWLFTPRAIDNLIDGKYTKIRERRSA